MGTTRIKVKQLLTDMLSSSLRFDSPSRSIYCPTQIHSFNLYNLDYRRDMLKLALLGLTAAYTAMAAPSLQARSVTCIDAQHWSNGGVSMAVPPNTECKVVNGVGDFYPV